MALSFPQSRQAALYYNRKARRARVRLRPNAGVSQSAATASPRIFTMAGSVPSGGTVKWAKVGATGNAAATITDATSLTTTVNVTGTGRITMLLASQLPDGSWVRDFTTLTTT